MSERKRSSLRQRLRPWAAGTSGLLVGLAFSLSGCREYYPARPQAPPPPERLPAELEATVTHLAAEIGERHAFEREGLRASLEWLEDRFRAAGYEPARAPVEIPDDERYGASRGQRVFNVVAEKRGTTRPQEVVVVGAHYDSKVASEGSWKGWTPPTPELAGTPGANDNASGVAGVLALAERLRNVETERTVRFVAFVNEEPPFFRTEAMGSRAYARQCREEPEIRVVAMVSLDMLGCFSPRPNEKRIPGGGLFGLPDRPDYVAFLSNLGSRELVEASAEVFAQHSAVDLRTLALPRLLPLVAWSDDWAFWEEGVPAFAVTDTAFMRCDHYHETSDTADSLDYEPMAQVVWALGPMLEFLATGWDPED